MSDPRWQEEKSPVSTVSLWHVVVETLGFDPNVTRRRRHLKDTIVSTRWREFTADGRVARPYRHQEVVPIVPLQRLISETKTSPATSYCSRS